MLINGSIFVALYATRIVKKMPIGNLTQISLSDQK